MRVHYVLEDFLANTIGLRSPKGYINIVTHAYNYFSAKNKLNEAKNFYLCLQPSSFHSVASSVILFLTTNISLKKKIEYFALILNIQQRAFDFAYPVPEMVRDSFFFHTQVSTYQKHERGHREMVVLIPLP